LIGKTKENTRTLSERARIGIANRGEPALRFIRAVRECNNYRHTDFKTVVFYLDIDKDAPFVQEAHIAIPLSMLDGYNPKNRGAVYLDKKLLIQGIQKAGCEAVWVGWGFLSEDPGFVSMVENEGFVFIGPDSKSMALLGDKIEAKRLAEKTDVPIVPWSGKPVHSTAEAREVIDRIGYPCIVKAANAGGGRGIRAVRTGEELEGRYKSARDETVRVTGGDTVFIEKLVQDGRHLEVQVLADKYGNVSTFGVRDCSVQRRNQKIIEETPPPFLTEKEIREMESAASRLISASGYQSAGTVEFLYDIREKKFYFMEVNTRLQVEHPITEELYGIDLVQGQILVAMGEVIEEVEKLPRGSVIEARLNAEDPDREFSPSPGKVTLFKPPAGPGIRVDSGIQEHMLIPQEFDSMIAKIISRGRDRGEAISRLKRALEEMQIRIEGGTTNRAFLRQLLENHKFLSGGVNTRFVDELLREREEVITRNRWDLALMATAVEKYLSAINYELTNFKQQLAWNGQPRDIHPPEGIQITLIAQGNPYKLLVKAVGDNYFHIECGGETFAICYQKQPYESQLIYRGERHRIQPVERGDTLQCEIDGIPYILDVESRGQVRAPSPSIVLGIDVEPGDEVEKGTVLLTLEAMKMEMIVSAPESGTVREVLVKPGEQVTAGQILIRLEEKKTEEEGSGIRRKRISFDSNDQTPEDRWDMLSRELKATFLGYDHRKDQEGIIDDMLYFAKTHPNFRDALFENLFTAIRIYGDIEILFSTSPVHTEGFARTVSFRELLSHYFRREVEREKGLSEEFIRYLKKALKWYYPGENLNTDDERTALFRMYKSHAELEQKQQLLKRTLFAIEDFSVPLEYHDELSNALDQIAVLTQMQAPSIADVAIHARYILVDRSIIKTLRAEKRAKVGRILDLILKYRNNDVKSNRHLINITDTGHHVLPELIHLALEERGEKRKLAFEILARRFTRDREFIRGDFSGGEEEYLYVAISENKKKERKYSTVLVVTDERNFESGLNKLTHPLTSPLAEEKDREIILLIRGESRESDHPKFLKSIEETPIQCNWFSLALVSNEGRQSYYTFYPGEENRLEELVCIRNINPIQYRELRVHRLRHFDLKQLYSTESVFLLLMTAKDNPRDERLIALVDVPTARMEVDEKGTIRRMVALENVFMDAVYNMRAEQAKRKRRLYWNRIVIHMRAVLNANLKQIRDYAGKLAVRAEDLGIEKLVVYSRRPAQNGQGVEEIELDFENISGTNFTLRGRAPSSEPMKPMDEYVAKIVRARQRGSIYPYEIIKMITHSGYQVKEEFPRGDFEEFDIKVDGESGKQEIIPVKGRAFGYNESNVVFGIITNYLDTHPEGIKRVLILSDTTRDMGSLAEGECRRINAAIDLAEERRIPVEWLPISAGARIEMESGTENLDWTARTLKRIIDFTQRGGEINIIVAGINVGAQSYWNAEATMLMHTRGVLIMTEDAAMLLTGKKALDFSGSVSAEDNIGIGGLKRIMGPNGEAQIPASNLYEAYTALFRHYSLTYVKPGEIFPLRLKTEDPFDRDISKTPYNDQAGQGFSTIGDIFSIELNPDRKKPFDMRQLMKAVVDHDTAPLERWGDMQDGETAIVWEGRLGGYSIGLIGIESKSLTRIGEVPHDGPETWSGGTLYPLSSRKVARGINAFSSRVPVVMLANLSGFDGSPESLRKLQLEFGAEIGRAVVNFKGPFIFVVTARYHGGAYVVFSKSLNPHLHVVALEGAYASVIGGAPAAAVVFPSLVRKETYSDPRIIEAQKKLKEGTEISQSEYDRLFYNVHTEKQKALAREFDSIHSVERAKKVGSIDRIISPSVLRPYLVQKIEEGMKAFKESL